MLYTLAHRDPDGNESLNHPERSSRNLEFTKSTQNGTIRNTTMHLAFDLYTPLAQLTLFEPQLTMKDSSSNLFDPVNMPISNSSSNSSNALSHLGFGSDIALIVN